MARTSRTPPTPTVTTTATRILYEDTLGARRGVRMQNTSGVDIATARGDDNGGQLTMDNGIIVKDGESVCLNGVCAQPSLWVIAATGPHTVRLETF